jgi:hypothetical protein
MWYSGGIVAQQHCTHLLRAGWLQPVAAEQLELLLHLSSDKTHQQRTVTQEPAGAACLT